MVRDPSYCRTPCVRITSPAQHLTAFRHLALLRGFALLPLRDLLCLRALARARASSLASCTLTLTLTAMTRCTGPLISFTARSRHVRMSRTSEAAFQQQLHCIRRKRKARARTSASSRRLMQLAAQPSPPRRLKPPALRFWLRLLINQCASLATTRRRRTRSEQSCERLSPLLNSLAKAPFWLFLFLV